MTIIFDSHKWDPFEKIGAILHEFNHLQIIIDSKLAKYLSISDPDKIILFHSSIVDFWWKIKLLKNFFKESLSDDTIQKLWELCRIRNDLAHNLIEQSGQFEFDSWTYKGVVISRIIKSFNHKNWEIEEKDIDELCDRFSDIMWKIQNDITFLDS